MRPSSARSRKVWQAIESLANRTDATLGWRFFEVALHGLSRAAHVRQNELGETQWEILPPLPILLFIVSTLLLAFAVKAAHAAVYKLRPVLCDNADDDADVPAFCALPRLRELQFLIPRRDEQAMSSTPCERKGNV